MAGCQTRAAHADPVEPDREFTLQGGQEATVAGEDLRIRFAEVLEDSRCPALVQCFWTGQARISMVVSDESGQTTIEFNTNPAPGQNRQTVDVDDHRIELRALDPYPQTPDEPIPFEDYRATLLVTIP